MNDIQMNFTVDFSLLTADLTGAVEKNQNGVEFLVMPQQSTASEPLPAETAINEINGFFKEITESDEFKLEPADILDKIKDIVGDIALAAVKFSIKQVFFHFIKPKEGGKVRLEYALSVGIDFGGKQLTDSSYAEVQSMTFGIWNTENKKIIDKMGLLNISDQLE